MLTDSHAHLTCDVFDISIDEVLKRASDRGIKSIINICTNPEELSKGLALKRRFPWIFNAAATTPHDAEKEGDANFEFMKIAAESGQLVAVGESGLDYHYYSSSQQLQKKLFIRYLQLALAQKLPVIVHCREAFADFFEIIDQHYIKDNRPATGVLHCFTGTYAEAEQVIQHGFYLSFSGIVTFKKSTELQKIAQMVPLHQLLIETDAPYLAPQNQRGKTNEPAFLLEIAQFIAQLRGITLESLAQATTDNAAKLFKIDHSGVSFRLTA